MLCHLTYIVTLNLSGNVIVFAEFKLHHKDWLTYSGGINTIGEFFFLKWPYLKG